MPKTVLRPAEWGAGSAADLFAYSYGIQTGSLVWVAGMVSRDIPTGLIVGESDAKRQTEQALHNMAQVLREAGCTLADVVHLTTYVTDRDLIAGVDETRKQHFKAPFPTNTVAIVAGLGDPAFLVELQAVAVVPAATRVDEDPVGEPASP